MGLVACMALVVANMVGTGVFTSLGFQVGALPSPFIICLLWGVGGIVALCGALSYGELASALPHSGGEYHFLSRIYHPALGFASGFVSVTVGFAAPIALAAIALGSHLTEALPGLPAKPVAFVAILSLAAIHALAVRASGWTQIVVTILKVVLILGFLALGWSKGNLSGVAFAPTTESLRLVLSPAFAVALLFVLYSYSGWNAVAYILDEVRDAPRTAPRAILLGTLFVTALYVALHALFLRSAPPASYDGQINVAGIAAQSLFGAAGGRLMAALVGVGLLASLSAMTWAGPRVSQAIGRDLPALGFLGATSPRGVPRPALALQTALALVFLATATFETVLIYAQFALATSGFLAVLGVLVLRRTRPDLPRPFRCPLFPAPPLIYLAITGVALAYAAIRRPNEAMAGVATLTLGVMVWMVAKSRKFACAKKANG